MEATSHSLIPNGASAAAPRLFSQMTSDVAECLYSMYVCHAAGTPLSESVLDRLEGLLDEAETARLIEVSVKTTAFS